MDARGGALFNLKPGPRLDAQLRARLAASYHEDLGLLEELTGKHVTAWRT